MRRLRETAEDAAAGPWVRDGTTDVFAGGCGCTGDLVATSRPDMERLPSLQQSANAKHIATFDPPTVLALIDVAEAAEARNEHDVVAALARLREVAQ